MQYVYQTALTDSTLSCAGPLGSGKVLSWCGFRHSVADTHETGWNARSAVAEFRTETGLYRCHGDDMTNPDPLLPPESVPGNGAVLNPFVMVDDAAALITFVCELFRVSETEEARTPMADGKLIHAEVDLGGVNLMIADRLDGWPAWPGLLQVWVRDVAVVLAAAADHGATIVTEPTAFYGETTLGRMLDRWGNIWWLWAPAVGQSDPDDGAYTIFSTLDETLRSLADQH